MATTRTKRPPGERRSQLLDCAQALFFTRGYEVTTVNDILEMAGLSKGAFYHYFDSKEALLDALAERVAAQLIEDAEPILSDASLDALARLNAFIAQSGQWKVERAPLLKAVFVAALRTDNVVLQHRLFETSARALTPVIVRIVEEGVGEGVFNPVAAEMVAEVLVRLGPGRTRLAVEAMDRAESGEIDAGAAILEGRLAAEAEVIERLLGAPQGAVRLVEPGLIPAMLRALVATAR